MGQLNAKLSFALKQCNQQRKYADRFISCAHKLAESERVLAQEQHAQVHQLTEQQRVGKAEVRLKRRLEQKVALETSRADQMQLALEQAHEKLPNLRIACGFLERRQEFMYGRLVAACDKLRELGQSELARKLEQAPNDAKLFNKLTGRAAEDALQLMMDGDMKTDGRTTRARRTSPSPERTVKSEPLDVLPTGDVACGSLVQTKEEFAA